MSRGYDTAWLLEREAKQMAKAGISKPVSRDGHSVLEIPLQTEIEQFCDKQWPRWPVIHCRTDLPSTIRVGAQDFTIFMPNKRVLCVEVKSKTGKLSMDQQAWKLEMQRNGFVVHEVRSMEEFHEAIRKEQA